MTMLVSDKAMAECGVKSIEQIYKGERHGVIEVMNELARQERLARRPLVKANKPPVK